MPKKRLIVLIAVALLVIAGVLILAFYANKQTNKQAGELDAFAGCLTEKGAVMYGAKWCQWCQKEKAAFGDSFRLVSYVECPENPKKCLSAGIEGYPTWIFSDGKKLVGYQGLEKLAQESGCELPVIHFKLPL